MEIHIPPSVQNALIGLVLLLVQGGFLYWMEKRFPRLKDYEEHRAQDAKSYEEHRAQDAEALKEKLDGIGKRIDPISVACTESTTAISKVEQRVTRSEDNITRLAKDVGHVESSVEKLEAQGLQIKADIIAAFQERAESISSGLQALEVTVGRLDERMKVTRELDNDRGKRG